MDPTEWLNALMFEVKRASNLNGVSIIIFLTSEPKVNSSENAHIECSSAACEDTATTSRSAGIAAAAASDIGQGRAHRSSHSLFEIERQDAKRFSALQ